MKYPLLVRKVGGRPVWGGHPGADGVVKSEHQVAPSGWDAVSTKGVLDHFVAYRTERVLEVQPGHCNARLSRAGVLQYLLNREGMVDTPLGGGSEALLGGVPELVAAEKGFEPTRQDGSEEFADRVGECNWSELFDVVDNPARLRDEDDVGDTPG